MDGVLVREFPLTACSRVWQRKTITAGAGIAVCRSPQGASDAAEDFYEGSRRGQCVFRPVCEMLWASCPQ
jgi:hypothetical protein